MQNLQRYDSDTESEQRWLCSPHTLFFIDLCKENLFLRGCQRLQNCTPRAALDSVCWSGSQKHWGCFKDMVIILQMIQLYIYLRGNPNNSFGNILSVLTFSIQHSPEKSVWQSAIIANTQQRYRLIERSKVYFPRTLDKLFYPQLNRIKKWWKIMFT